MLAADPTIGVVGEGDLGAIREAVKTASPQILLADVRIEGALVLCAEIRRNGSRPWTILMGAESDDDWAMRALEAGARGILAKTACGDDLIKAIRVVHGGEIWARKSVMARIVETLATLTGAVRAEQTLLSDRLSLREREIVQHAAGGLSNTEIASRLGISGATVKAHLTHIFQKLGVRDRGQLAARYHRSLRPSSSR